MKTNTAILIFFFPALLWSNRLLAQDQTWSAPKSADELTNPYKDNASATAEGKKIYTQMCAFCHGATGKGNGAAGLTLEPKPADFLSIRVTNESDGAIFWKMTEGKAPMASYKELLSEEQRWKLVNYIRKLETKKH